MCIRDSLYADCLETTIIDKGGYQQISIPCLLYTSHGNEIEWVTTATTVREAVFTTAGEYRTPFYMFRTRKEEGGNE